MCRKSDPHYLTVMNRRMRTWCGRRGGGGVPSASVFLFPLLTSVHSACVRTSPGRRTDPPRSPRRPAAAPRRPPRRKLPPGLRGRRAASAECQPLRSPAQIWEPCRRFRSFSLSSSTSSFYFLLHPLLLRLPPPSKSRFTFGKPAQRQPPAASQVRWRQLPGALSQSERCEIIIKKIPPPPPLVVSPFTPSATGETCCVSMCLFLSSRCKSCSSVATHVIYTVLTLTVWLMCERTRNYAYVMINHFYSVLLVPLCLNGDQETSDWGRKHHPS